MPAGSDTGGSANRADQPSPPLRGGGSEFGLLTGLLKLSQTRRSITAKRQQRAELAREPELSESEELPSYASDTSDSSVEQDSPPPRAPSRSQQLDEPSGIWDPSDTPRAVTLMHIFSNTDRPGGLSDATRAGGGSAINVDIKIGGDRHSILDDVVYEALCRWAASGLVEHMWLGVVCSSFSLLWTQPGRIKLRSRQHPEGLLPLPPKWFEYVQRGNMIVRRAVTIAILQYRSGRSFFIENVPDYGYPQSPLFRWSKRAHVPIWITSWMRGLASEVPLLWGTTAMCGWGGPFHKPTTVCGAGPNASAVLGINEVQCTTLRHELLATGVDSQGRQLSPLSGEYPPLFCAYFAYTFTRGVAPHAPSAAAQTAVTQHLLSVIDRQRASMAEPSVHATPASEPSSSSPSSMLSSAAFAAIAVGWRSAHDAIPTHWPEREDVMGERYARVRADPLPYISRRRAEPESAEVLARRPMPQPVAPPTTAPKPPRPPTAWPEGCPPRPIRIAQLYHDGVYADIMADVDEVRASCQVGEAGGEPPKVHSSTYPPELQPAWARQCPWDTSDPDDCVPLQPTDSEFLQQGARPAFFTAWAAKLKWPDEDMIAQVTQTGVEGRSDCTRATVVMGHHGGLRKHYREASESVQADTKLGFMSTGRRDLWVVPSILVAKNCVRRRIWKLIDGELTRTIKWRVSTDDSIEVEGEVSRNNGMDREEWSSAGLPNARTLGEMVAIVKSVCDEMGLDALPIELEQIALWAFDLSHAYRELAIQRMEQGQQCFVWSDGVRKDQRCVFGAAHMVDLFQRVTSFVLAVGQHRILDYERQHPPSPARQAWLKWRREACGLRGGSGQSTIYLDDGLGLTVLAQGEPIVGHAQFASTPSTAMVSIEPSGVVKLDLFVNKSRAQVDLAIMRATFQEAGWDIAVDKVQLGLAIQELGLMCSSEGDGALTVPEAKRQGMLREIAEQQNPAAADRAVPLEDVEGLSGRCLHIAMVAHEANPYMQPMYRMQRAKRHLPTRRGKRPIKVKLSRVAVQGSKPAQIAYQQSLKWWQHALEGGISAPLSPKLAFPALGEPGTAFMFTDAAREDGTGHGAFTFVRTADGQLVFLYIDPRWPDDVLADLQSNKCSMPAGEGLGAVIFADLLATALMGLTHLVLFTDSSAVAAALNSNSSPSPQINHLVKWLFERHPRLQLIAIHQPGVRNSAADGLSRSASSQVIADAVAAGAHAHEMHMPEYAYDLMRVTALTDQRTPHRPSPQP